MAGAAVQFDDAALRRLGQRLAALGRAPTRDMFEDLAAEGEAQTRFRIANEKRAPDGTPWPDWSEQYAETRHSGHSLLQGEGDLLDSMGAFVYLDGTGAEWGSDLIYAATHQFGDSERNIPQREYLGITPENEADLERIMDSWMEEQMERLQ